MATSKKNKKLKILFIHGLNSGPFGNKVVPLRKDFDVCALDMKMSMKDITRINSVYCNVFKQQILPILLCIIITIYNTLFGVTIIILYLSFAYIYKDLILSKAWQSSMNACIEIQKTAIIQYKPDLLIGSSWGGAVTVEIIKREIWNGPCILLCPSYYKHYQRMYGIQKSDEYKQNILENAFCLNLKENKNNKKYLIVHGQRDKCVPLRHSTLLRKYNINNFNLKQVKRGNHLLSKFTESGELNEIVKQYMNEKYVWVKNKFEQQSN
eukprot:469931_1